MQLYTENLISYKRLPTREVSVGGLLLGNRHPIRVQTMTTTDTMDTLATVEQTIRCIKAGAELVRITAPSKKEAENLLHIRNELHRRGYKTPLVADIHFTPNAAEIAARIVEKVRVNPGNYVDKKKFELIDYTDADYAEEIDRIRERFTPLVKICKEYGTAMRIGTNHGSLSDRIMSRYGDTPMGMVESAMEFLRIARGESYHNIVLSMKSSNPQVMVQAYRLLVRTMQDEFGLAYPLHLGVTEAGDGEDGRIKSAVGIGTLLEEGIGDTIRVSLTEDPELEIPVCKDIVKRYKSPSPKVGLDVEEGTKAPSRWEGEDASDILVEEDTVGYRYADPALYGLLKGFVEKHRSNPTPAEAAMWILLRTKKLEGYKFRRQHIIDRYIADFICLKEKLVIEIDGLIHQLPENMASDEIRTNALKSIGFRVIRFFNEQVINQTEQVIEEILSNLKQDRTNKEHNDLSSPTGGQGAYKRRETFEVSNMGGRQVPVVIADLSKLSSISPTDLQSIGYTYNELTDKWTIADTAADYVFTGNTILPFALPGTLKVIVYPVTWLQTEDKEKYFPIWEDAAYTKAVKKSSLNFVMVDCYSEEPVEVDYTNLEACAKDSSVVLCLSSQHSQSMPAVRRMFIELMNRGIKNPVVIIVDSNWSTPDEHLVHYGTEAGALLLDGFGDGICLGMTAESYQRQATSLGAVSGRNYQQTTTVEGFINNVAFIILQATRTRISKTEYISCPSCGRTLFDLQETTAKIRAVTNHLKGVKIAIMGCIVNGPGEMADADFGYVGSGPGKITLYKGKEVVKKNVPSDVAVEELINLLKENDAWIDQELTITN
ncbi:MAG: ispG [Flaviaesturariibacter sp.]|nr:ispG [Flaviaesturariibacter sp.]